MVGMGAMDALFLLENSGLQVRLSGKGSVVSQSLKPGTPIGKGQHIQIELN
ncbi:MAG: PASTA domain-containing protein [Flavobacteriales bacterium]